MRLDDNNFNGAQLQASENRKGAIGALVSVLVAIFFNVMGSYIAYLLKIN